MKKDDFMDAWNDVDKDFLAEADDMRRRKAQHDNGKKRLAVLLATAAVLTVGIALTAVILIRGNSKEMIIPATEPTADTSVSAGSEKTDNTTLSEETSGHESSESDDPETLPESSSAAPETDTQPETSPSYTEPTNPPLSEEVNGLPPIEEVVQPVMTEITASLSGFTRDDFHTAWGAPVDTFIMPVALAGNPDQATVDYTVDFWRIGEGPDQLAVDVCFDADGKVTLAYTYAVASEPTIW